ncbi:8-oxo-dGTP diphosphatase MutT [Aeromonas lusitana]|uniref:8-oxo-dGTP diphosphatase n=1 Tax=Aeromonas lusitana TaxID=931529 RepID=A0A2M8H7C5_9GAMM|nr:8-oxo-dGTP diphosphatase MutT [Aeromonas lusitana]PJC92460.1 8-oxo-dGTP diphosphatase MutT [Aeromonas lusitana]
MEAKKRIWVAVGVIENEKGEIFLAKRSSESHQGDRWEFPGGKVESGEDLLTALDRELWEEIGIRVQDCAPFMELHHDYPDKQVLLDIWKVTRFDGEPFGKEGQECRWVPLTALHEYRFPDANGPIVTRLQEQLVR